MSEHSAGKDVRVVADLIVEHAHPGELLYIFKEAWMKCACGHRIEVEVVRGCARVIEANEAWRLHVAAAIVEALPRVIPPEQGAR